MSKVLILDASHRSALAATRSLGRRGIYVVAADEIRPTIAGASKYCREKFVYPSAYREPEAFLQFVAGRAHELGISTIFPMTEVTTGLLLRNRQQFREFSIPFSSFESYNALTDKWNLGQMARSLGVPCPKTHFINSRECLDSAASELTYPAVIKPYRSRIWSGSRWISATVKYAHSFGELQKIVSESECFNQHPFLIQEYVRGRPQGIFTIFQHGSPVLFFAHRRLREKPPSGGVSVLSESVEVDRRARETAERILRHVQWHGVAMVEFRVSDDGTPYLIEVNARFWGSLQLAIDAGVDFPWLAYRLAAGEPVEAIEDYRVGVRSRWLLGDAAHLWQLFFSANGNGRKPEKLWTLMQFMNLFDAKTRYEVNRWDDLAPAFCEFRRLLAKCYNSSSSPLQK